MSALSGSTATAVAHWSDNTRRSPAGFTALMVHEAVGVRRRLPVMIRAGANTLTGFLKEMIFPARAKVSSQEPSWIQAPSSFASTAFAAETAPDAMPKASTAVSRDSSRAHACVLVEREGKPLSDLSIKETSSLLRCLI